MRYNPTPVADSRSGTPHVREGSDRQSRRDRLPHRAHAAAMGIASVAVYFGRRSRCARTCSRPTRRSASARRRPARAISTIDRILEAARADRRRGDPSGLRLSERERGVCAGVRARGIVFIGPTRGADRGLRAEAHGARARAERCGVPLLPGTGCWADLDEALARGASDRLSGDAQEHGRRRRHRHARVCTAARRAARRPYEAVARLAATAFGDGGVFLERFVRARAARRGADLRRRPGRRAGARERDCSVQRRNQKVIEETPAPGLDAATARRLC